MDLAERTTSNLKAGFDQILTVTTAGGETRTISGVVYVWAEDRSLAANAGRALLRIGDTRTPLPSGALLAPWRLMALLPSLRAAFPALNETHYEAMMSTNSLSSAILAEIKALAALPAHWTASEGKMNNNPQSPDDETPSCSLNSPAGETAAGLLDSTGGETTACRLDSLSGEALACLLVLKALSSEGVSASSEETTTASAASGPLNDDAESLAGFSLASLAGILRDPLAAPHRLLTDLTGFLLNHDQPLSAPVGHSGPVRVNELPTLPLSAVEAAQLYHALALPVPKDLLRMAPDEVEAMLHHWENIARLLVPAHTDLPFLQTLTETLQTAIVAHRDPQGLLCVGIGANPRFADGLGIYIQLADPAEACRLETILHAVLSQLGFELQPLASTGSDETTSFHFQLS